MKDETKDEMLAAAKTKWPRACWFSSLTKGYGITVGFHPFIATSRDVVIQDESYEACISRIVNYGEPPPAGLDHGCTSEELARIKPIAPGFFDAISKIPPDEPKFDDD